MIIALIPAHNEAAGIAAAVESLKSQTLPPDRIIVIADNCADNTTTLARAAGAEVFETVDNKHKKAGGLNQVLTKILPTLPKSGAVLIQDADTELSSTFIETGVKVLKNRRVGACGGSFFSKTEDTMVRLLQGNEYQRYVREISRRKDARANVLTGAGSLFKIQALREVIEARNNGTLPGEGCYKQDALTEDNELTLAIKRLGYRVVSPKGCSIYTDTPATVRELFHQRRRWRRGAMEDLWAHGFSWVTAPYLMKMLWSIFVTVLSTTYIGVLAYFVIMSQNPFVFHWFWTSVFVLYVFDRVWTIRGRSWQSRLTALAVLPELIYDLFQQVVLMWALFDFVLRRDQAWVHS